MEGAVDYGKDLAMSTGPTRWIWSSENCVLRPMKRDLDRCRKHLVDGEVYHLEPIDEVQAGIDKAYHITMREAWKNLPEELSLKFPSSDDFRKHCLCACGFATTRRVGPFASVKAARDAIGAFSASAAQIELDGAFVVVTTPMSQAMRGDMTREERWRSYRETQDLAAALVGVTPKQLEDNAERAA